MLRYKERRTVPERYRSDVIRISQALEDHDYDCSYWDAYKMWDNYSDSLCAGWINLPETDDKIREILIDKEVDDD